MLRTAEFVCIRCEMKLVVLANHGRGLEESKTHGTGESEAKHKASFAGPIMICSG